MPAPKPRVVAIDTVRGLALCGMVLFHLQWDLAYWGWQDLGPADSPAWMLFGHAVAATFLFVSGFCLMLAHDGTPSDAVGGEPDRLYRSLSLVRRHAPSLRRIALLAGVALLISAATRVIFPDDFIFFGIIHCIAVSNLVGLAFLRAPPAITLLAGGLAALMPRLVASAWFDGPAWWWLGLSTTVPSTLDYRPLLPWLAFVLFGIAAARLRRRPSRLDHDVARKPVPMFQHDRRGRRLAPLAWAGRHSLSIYVVHQPVLFGLFLALSVVHPAGPPAAQAAFERQCRAQCVAAGAGQAGCDAACLCVFRTMQRHIATGPDAAPPSRPELESASAACLGTEAQKP